MILLHIMNIYEYNKRVLPLLYGWDKLWKFWNRGVIQKEVDFHVLQSCLEQDQLEERQQKWIDITPTCGFGIEDVKEKSYDVTNASFQISTTLSLLGNLDPYWESQILVEYSKNLFTCKVLDGQVIDGRHRVVDEVI